MDQEQLEPHILFRKALRELFKQPNGKTVLDFLVNNYVDTSAVGADSNNTYYRLGQKELIQGLVREATLEDQQINIQY